MASVKNISTGKPTSVGWGQATCRIGGWSYAVSMQAPVKYGPAGALNRQVTTIMTPTQARELADSLIAAANNVDQHIKENPDYKLLQIF